MKLENSSYFGINYLIYWLAFRLNPLDQPAVELGKRLAKAKLGALAWKKKKMALVN